MDEIVAIVDENNNVVDAKPRSFMRKMKLPHRATYILVFNTKGQIFIQKRTVIKDIYPGYYDVATGGVVLDGETYDDSARRELAEELGINNIPLLPLFKFYFENNHCKVWGKAYLCIYNGKLILQKEEVESGEFYSPGEALNLGEQGLLTPDGYYVLKRYLDDLKNPQKS